MCIQWNFDWTLFLLRPVRMCNRRCLHSSMIGMLCTAFWGPSRALKQLHVVHVLNHLLWFRIERVVNFVLLWILLKNMSNCGVLDFLNRFTNTRAFILFHNRMWKSWKSMFISFSIVCSWLDSSRFTTGAPFYHELFRFQRRSLCIHERNVFGIRLGHYLCDLFQQQVVPFHHVSFYLQRWDSCCHEMNAFGFFLFHQRVSPLCHVLFYLQRRSSCCHQMNVFGRVLTRDLCHGRQRVSPFYRF